uniref:GspE/PulE family protein n=1 Tax=Serratia marcescens TaxID=615 RepID=UPI001495756A
RHRFLPLAVDAERVLVATSEPLVQEWRRDLQHLTRRSIELAVVNPLDLHRYTMEFYGVTRSVRGARGDVRGEASTTLPSFEQLVELGRTGDVNADDQHIVHIVDWLLQYAYEQRASDIHLEPRREMGRMRFRIDGVLHKVFEVPPAVMTAVVSRIKVLGRMDLAERRRPQDGRIKTRSPGGREVEMRLSTMPTAFGEKCVMRIFDPDAAFKSIDQLGFSPQEAAGWNALVERPHGIVLVTGPTGSGKTTTLYTALSQLNTADVKIITVEDPVEYQIEGINQIQAKPQIGLDFANALRSIVRQDPDIIMIGEMRDLETARIAIQSALTGHLVLSTLHTNNAAGGITRLLDMGVEDYLLTSTINGILAQRLVRRLEPTHAERYEASPEEIERFELRRLQPEGPIHLYRPKPSALAPTGYLGRTTIMEFLVINDALRRAVMRRDGMGEIERIAREAGMRTMYEDGLSKALSGQTTIEEVLRVTEES